MEIERQPVAAPAAGEERSEVARLFAAYCLSHDPAIRESLVLLHLGLVARLVRRFRLGGAEADDLRQVGCLGLIGAIDRYDPGRGVPFVGYAVPSVLGEIRRYFRDKASTVRLPRRTGGGDLQGDCSLQVSRGPQDPPVASGLAYPQNDGGGQPGVDEEPWGSSGWGAAGGDPGTLAEEEAGYARSEDREVVRRVLHRLSPRERIVLYLRFHEGLSQAKVAKRLGATQMRVYRWEHRALDKLRQAIGAIW